MTKIGLVASGRQKLKQPAPAQDIYTSTLFTKSRQWAEQHCERWYILSAKHGLLDPHKLIEPYNLTLNKMNKQEHWHWSSGVMQVLSRQTQPSDRLVLLAGRIYREYIIQQLEIKGYILEVPLAGLDVVTQLLWLTENTRND